MTAIAVAHHIPYVAQAAGAFWHDLSVKAERAAAADGPAFLNVLSDCPLGWGHDAKLGPAIGRLAVESRFWPLYEVVDGRYRLTHRPDGAVPLDEWLRPQKRFAHLFRPEAEEFRGELQRQVDADWSRLVARCEADALAAA
jgi:pyruvate ferredoxin oxidoreductase beta subunit